MTVGELCDLLNGADSDQPVVMWNDANGQNGDVDNLIFTDGQVTICGTLR